MTPSLKTTKPSGRALSISLKRSIVGILECKVFLAGSGLQFANRGEPLHETDPFDASSAYSVERIHSVYSARYFRTLGVRVYVGYLFHHESPLRKPTHVSQKIVQAVKQDSCRK